MLLQAARRVAQVFDVKFVVMGHSHRAVDAQVKLESYRVLTPSAELSADVAWFIQWLKSELEADFPEARIN